MGDHRGALLAFREAHTLTRRVRLPVVDGPLAAMGEAGALLALGRAEEALAVYEDSTTFPGLDGCGQARRASNHAWILLLAPPEVAARKRENPRELLAGARRRAFGEAPCSSSLQLHIVLNQALAAARQGDTFAAWQALQVADALPDVDQPLNRAWRLDIEARLTEDPLARRELLAEMEGLAEVHGLPAVRWRALVGRGRAEADAGELETALATYAAAEALLDSESFKVPLQAQRERFLSQREEGIRHYLDLLLRVGKVDEALEVARRSRGRVLRGVFEAHRLVHLDPASQRHWETLSALYWEKRQLIEAEQEGLEALSAESRERAQTRLAGARAEAQALLDRALHLAGLPGLEGTLPPLPERELVLLYHPLPEGWVRFAALGGTVTARRFELPGEEMGPSLQGEALLAELEEAIPAAERVRILAYGALQAVDFHALPFAGDVLLASTPVVYGLDLPVAPERAGERADRALVVTAAEGLRGVEAEAATVRERLAAAGWEVALLGEPFDRGALRAALREAPSLLHYAGHSVFEADNFRATEESGLLLTGGRRFTQGDVLSLPTAPRQVVLASCEAAAQHGAVPVPGLGLAQAFLVVGAQRVVAATRKVPDGATQEFFQDFYRRWDRGTDLAHAFRAAQLRWRQSDGATWASFRVLEP
jgi:hypothetical protein